MRNEHHTWAISIPDFSRLLSNLDKKENFIKKHDREKSTNTNMVIKMDIVVILQLLSVLLALIVALILCWQIIGLKEEFKGRVLFNALNSYIAIQKD
jgi:cytochrome bd-type quinol oxidase subunit 1